MNRRNDMDKQYIRRGRIKNYIGRQAPHWLDKVLAVVTVLSVVWLLFVICRLYFG